jgi:hypothetical protein
MVDFELVQVEPLEEDICEEEVELGVRNLRG